MRFLIEKILYNKKIRILIMGLIDIIAIFFSGIVALLIRFEFSVNDVFVMFLDVYFQLALSFVIVTLIIFIIFKMYSTMWSVASIREAFIIFVACLVSAIFYHIIVVIFDKFLPRSFYLLSFIFLYAFEMIIRFSYRIYKIIIKSFDKVESRVMIVGAGEAGSLLLKEIRTSKFTKTKVVCFIDDSEFKIGKNLNGIKIVGNRNDILAVAKKYSIDEIYIAIPTATLKDRKEIIDICTLTGCKIKVLPGIFQLMSGEVSVKKLRDIDIEDLLMREPVDINLNSILSFVENKIVLVTGAGGSIGSEISRQIAMHKPKKLILLDIYENSIYELQNELRKKLPNLDLLILISSIRDRDRIYDIFSTHRPNIVFHAAAHKHVPLMEDNPNEAIKNNCLGTLNVANASDKFSVEKFILISTDKAVNPTSVMGASKRICEMIVQYKSKHSTTNFAAVRFGNVLGSNGSVVPLFKKQIEDGGPITITDKNITRYFMTIPEAVALVLQAAVFARGGEIFVLDMGKPVKILDLAINLIKLSGLEPYADIDIKFIGLRKGEKLFEELLMDEEGLRETNNKRIFIGRAIEFNEDEFIKELEDLIKSAEENDKNIKLKIKKIVSTYTGI